MATFTDDFNRANETPLASPYLNIKGANFILQSNSVKSSAFGDNITILNAESNDDQSASANLLVPNGSGTLGVVVRANDSDNHYKATYFANGDDIQVRKVVGGTNTSLFTTNNIGLLSGDKITLEAVSTTISLYINDVLQDSITDTDLSSGKAGMLWTRSGDDSHLLDDFVATGIVPSFSITDVDTDNIIEDGQQDISIPTTGFTSPITTINLKVGDDRIALSGLTRDVDTYTADLMDVTALTSGTVGLPFSSTTYQNEIEATDGTDTAVINITRNPKAGWAVIDVVGCVTTKGSIAEGRTEGAYSDGSQVLYETKDGTTIGPDLIIKSDGLTASGKVWDVDTGRYEDWTIDFPALADSTTPVLTLVPSTTVYNLTVGDNFTLPTVTVTDTDVNDDPVTATVTPTVTDNRNGQGVGSVVYTYTYTDGTNLAVPINITVNYEAVPDTSIPTLSAVPATTTYNLTNGANFTLPTISRTDNGTTAAITPVIRRNGQVVASVDTSIEGTYTITANYSDAAGNAAEPLVITVNVASAIVQSSINMTLTGIPDNQYITRVINVSTNQVIFSGNVTWANSSATQLLEEIPSGTEVEYYAIGVNDGGLNRGTTS